MKQIVQNLKTGQTEVVDVPVPKIKSGQLLVQTAFSLVSAGTERNLVEFAQKNLLGKARSRPDLMKQVIEKSKREGVLTTIESALNRLDQPLALGYSSAGTVLEIGSGVHNFKPGDRVVCAGGGHAVHAEFAAIPSNLAAQLPPEVDFESGAFATMGAIALNGIRLAKPQIGENIAIIGLGLLGLICAQIVKAAGCQIVGVDVNPTRVRFAKKLGILALMNDRIADQYLAMTHGYGFDHVLICADTPENDTVVLAGHIARDRGHVISLGVVGLDLPRKPFFEKELFFQVSRSSGPGRYDRLYEEEGHDYPIGYVRWTEGRNLEAFVELIRSERIIVKPLITHQFEISEAVKAYDLVTGNTQEDYLGILLKYPTENTNLKNRIDFASHSHGTISSPTQISLGVLGAGNYANAVFLPVVRRNGKASLIGIASSTGSNAQNSGKRYGFKFSTSSEQEIINNPEINTIAVLTQHDSHADLTIQSLQEGKHVYCEKPLAISVEQLKLIEKELKKEKHPYLMVGFNRRFAQYARKLREFLDDRPEPAYAHYRVNAGYLPLSHWLQHPSSGGGRLIGEGCHFIDFLNFIIGQYPTQVNVTGLPDLGKYNQDNFLISLEYPDGSLGTISYLANGNKNFSKEYFEIFCSGKIGILNDFRFLELIDDNHKKKYISKLRQDKGHQTAWDNFLNAVMNNGQEPISYDDILNTSYVTLACDQSLRSKQPIIMSEFISGS